MTTTALHRIITVKQCMIIAKLAKIGLLSVHALQSQFVCFLVQDQQFLVVLLSSHLIGWYDVNYDNYPTFVITHIAFVFRALLTSSKLKLSSHTCTRNRSPLTRFDAHYNLQRHSPAPRSTSVPVTRRSSGREISTAAAVLCPPGACLPSSPPIARDYYPSQYSYPRPRVATLSC